MPGPARTPTPILEARGSRWPERRGNDEMRLPVERPSCPSWLTAEARAEWRRIVPQLEQAGVIAKVDRALLAAYCEAWGEFVKMVQLIQQQGELIKTTNGNVIHHPYLSVRNRARQVLLQLAQQFGLSPSARTRIRSHEQEQDSGTEGKARFFRLHG